jgi:hypothetical protein
VGDPEGNTPGKRQVAVLLGAGASADAGIPTSVRMPDEIAEQLRDHPDSRRLLDFVRFTLAADAASQGPSTPIDIERLFTAVEMLIDRHEQPWSPFVSTWVRGLESFATRRISRAGVGRLSKLDDYIQSASAEGGSQPFGRRFGGRLNYGFDKPSKLVMNAIRGELRNLQPPDVGVQLKYVRALMIEKLLDVLQIPDPGQVAYLDPLIDLYRAQGGSRWRPSTTTAPSRYSGTSEAGSSSATSPDTSTASCRTANPR